MVLFPENTHSENSGVKLENQESSVILFNDHAWEFLVWRGWPIGFYFPTIDLRPKLMVTSKYTFKQIFPVCTCVLQKIIRCEKKCKSRQNVKIFCCLFFGHKHNLCDNLKSVFSFFFLFFFSFSVWFFLCPLLKINYLVFISTCSTLIAKE